MDFDAIIIETRTGGLHWSLIAMSGWCQDGEHKHWSYAIASGTAKDVDEAEERCKAARERLYERARI